MIDISDIKVGDRVRVSNKIGDEATFTVTRVVGSMLGTPRNIYQSADWDHIQKIAPPLPTKPGYYLEKVTSVTTQIWLMAYDGATWATPTGWRDRANEEVPRDLIFLSGWES